MRASDEMRVTERERHGVRVIERERDEPTCIILIWAGIKKLIFFSS